MKKAWMCAVCLVVCVAFAASTALQAQSEPSQPRTYSYVSLWTLPRAQWGEMAKYLAADSAQMNKLVADGTVTGYGEFENFIHTEGGPTQGEWFTATSESGILKVLEGDYSHPDIVAAPVLLTATKHYDLFLENIAYGGRAGTFDGAYQVVEQWEVKVGQMHAFLGLLKGRFVPILNKMVADGTLVSYVVERQDFDTDNPGTVSVVTILPNASAFDTATKAFEAAFGKDPELGPALAALTSEAKHWDSLLHLAHMVEK